MSDPFRGVPLACPIDGLPLAATSASYCCDGGHSFDIAKQGYLNLLPVQYKSSRDPGDSKIMVQARREVMNLGFYEDLADQLCRLLSKQLTCLPDDLITVIDAGCGEGFYTAAIQQHLRASMDSQTVCVVGADVSKWAIIAAAKKYPELACTVATNRHLPLLPGYASVITSIFGFETWDDWSKLQTTGQIVIVIDAGPDHLLELRQQIYPEVHIHDEPQHYQAHSAGYTLADQLSVVYQQTADSSQTIMKIIGMTPHVHRVKPEALDSLKNLNSLTVTINAVIRVYQRD